MIKRVPFLRVMLPFCAGICFSLCWEITVSVMTPLLVLTGLLVFCCWKVSNTSGRSVLQPLVNGLCPGVIFLMALQGCWNYKATHHPGHYSHALDAEVRLICRVSDIPIEKEKSWKVPLNVQWQVRDGNYRPAEGDILAYAAKRGSALRYGDVIVLEASALEAIPAPLNPGEFDYKTFLADKNIFHQVYLPDPDSVKLEGLHFPNYLMDAAMALKSYMIQRLKTNGLHPDAAAISAALLVGYDDEIDREVMIRFSHSGTLHILSVSGMHTGLIYALIVFVFSMLDKHNRQKRLQFILTLLVLWGFAMLTGFSPSVLRAVIMLSLILAGKLFFRQVNSYNILLVSAFLILFFQPLLIRDAGFLLSYLAVWGILYFEPGLRNLLVVQQPLLKLLWGWTTVSLAAQIMTLPISLYYFHQFPIWFLPANLIIVPLSTLLMGAGALYVLLAQASWLGWICNALTSAMLWLAGLTDREGSGYVDRIPCASKDVLLFYLILIAGMLWGQYKRVVFIYGLLGALLLWQIINLYERPDKEELPELLVYHIRQGTYVQVRKGRQLYALKNDLLRQHYDRYVKNAQVSLGLLAKSLPAESLWQLGTWRVLMTDTGMAPRLIQLADPRLLLLRHNLKLRLDTLQLQHLQLVIADGSNSKVYVKRMALLCEKWGIPFRSTYDGAQRVGLSE